MLTPFCNCLSFLFFRISAFARVPRPGLYPGWIFTQPVALCFICLVKKKSECLLWNGRSCEYHCSLFILDRPCFALNPPWLTLIDIDMIFVKDRIVFIFIYFLDATCVITVVMWFDNVVWPLHNSVLCCFHFAFIIGHTASLSFLDIRGTNTGQKVP